MKWWDKLFESPEPKIDLAEQSALERLANLETMSAARARIEWSSQDSEAWGRFLSGPLGLKLRAIMESTQAKFTREAIDEVDDKKARRASAVAKAYGLILWELHWLGNCAIKSINKGDFVSIGPQSFEKKEFENALQRMVKGERSTSITGIGI